MYPDKEKGFMTFNRETAGHDAPGERVRHFNEFHQPLPEEALREQAYRCMNCGVPFCHHGCPLGNMIPDFNDAVKDNDWPRAIRILHSTNNFPEFTGRVCPAPCEGACVLGINEPPVTIEQLEFAIAERAWAEGWIQPEPPQHETGKSVAVIGSGPCGLAAAQQLRRAGHQVTVFERAGAPGGLLMYGIPNFKLGKREIVQRRIAQLEAEGVVFRCNADVGKNVPVAELDGFDAVLIAAGSTVPRTFHGMNVPGADLDGIYPAMEFLPQATKRVLGKTIEEVEVLATGKNVVVIGGGDTGSDCVGTSLRQNCTSLLNLELLPCPPEARAEDNPWPQWPLVFRTSSSHEEGGERRYCMLTKSFEDDGQGHVAALHAVEVAWNKDATGRFVMTEKPGTETRIPCELVLLAMGFVAPEADAFVAAWSLEMGKTRFGQAVQADAHYRTNNPRIFAAGDARRGQSLVVWAIAEGREAARAIDLALMGRTGLPGRDTQGYETLGVAAERC